MRYHVPTFGSDIPPVRGQQMVARVSRRHGSSLIPGLFGYLPSELGGRLCVGSGHLLRGRSVPPSTAASLLGTLSG